MKMIRYVNKNNSLKEPVDILYETSEDRNFLDAIIKILPQYDTAKFYWDSGKSEFERFQAALHDVWLDGLLCSRRWYSISQLMLKYSMDVLYEEEKKQTDIGHQFKGWKQLLWDLNRIDVRLPHAFDYYDNPIFIVDNVFFEPLWLVDHDNTYAYRELHLGSNIQILHQATICGGEKIAVHGLDIPWSEEVQAAYSKYLAEQQSDVGLSEIVLSI